MSLTRIVAEHRVLLASLSKWCTTRQKARSEKIIGSLFLSAARPVDQSEATLPGLRHSGRILRKAR